MTVGAPALLLFARAPRIGLVKTRLHPALGAEGATRLYAAFLADAARAYAPPALWTPVLCADEELECSDLTARFPAAWRRSPQTRGDLGDRLTAAFESAFAWGAPAAVAVGADHPALPRRDLERLLARLGSGCEACLIPADDGGYCAIGLGPAVPPGEVFHGVPWSSADVLRETLLRLAALGTRYALLSPLYDVDRPEDLRRLAADLASRDPQEPDYPRETAAALEAFGVRGGPR